MEELLRYWSILKHRWLPASLVFIAVLIVTSIKTAQQKPIYQAEGRIILKGNSASSLAGVGEGTALEALNKQSNSAPTQVELIRSVPVVQEVITILDLDEDTASFLRKLRVRPLESTDLIEITYDSRDPEQSTRIVETVMDVYLEKHIQSQRSEARAAKEFLEDQLPQVENQVLQAEAALRQFKEKYQVINLGSEATSTESSLAAFNKEKSEITANLAAITGRLRQFQQLFGNDLYNSLQVNIVSQSPGIQQVLTDLREVQQQLILERTRFRENNPTIIDLAEKEAALKQLLQQRIQETAISNRLSPNRIIEMPSNQGSIQQSLLQDYASLEAERIGLQQKLAALAQIEAAYQQRAAILPGLEQRQRELERQVNAAQSTYEQMLTRIQEVRLTENQNVGYAQVAVPAYSSGTPIGTGPSRRLRNGVLLGAFLGAATALALDSLDKSVNSEEDAKALLGYPLIGSIPLVEEPNANSQLYSPRSQLQIFVTQSPFSAVAEAFRKLQTNLKFTNSDHQPKVVVVSSSVPKEGKSTTVANLAVVKAQLGARVLIVDADMRQPTQHKIWAIPNLIGLSNVLTEESTLDKAIVEVMPNLEVLPLGFFPPNPLALLESTRMATLIEQWSKDYDFVVLDSPPITVAADTSVLGKLADGLIFVVRPGAVDADQVKSAKQTLEQSEQNVLGLVTNGIKHSHDPYYYYYVNHEALASRSNRLQKENQV